MLKCLGFTITQPDKKNKTSKAELLCFTMLTLLNNMGVGTDLSMGRLDQAQTPPEPENASPNPARIQKYFKVVNEPEKARTIINKFLFNLMQNFNHFKFYKPYFTICSCETLS